MAEQNGNKNKNNSAEIGFEQKIWAAADILRGNMDAGEYKHVVLGLIFLKYISDKFEERYQELLTDDDDVEDKDAYTEVNVFFVPPERAGMSSQKLLTLKKSVQSLTMPCGQLKKKISV